MHKIVNGKRVELSPEEERNVLDEREKAKAKEKAERESERQRLIRKEQAKAKIMQTCGLSEDELKEIFGQ